MTSRITRYELMPIPPVEEHTEYFDAGVVRFGIQQLDPSRIDVGLLLDLVDEYGGERFTSRLGALESAFAKLEPEPPTLDEWAACGIERAEDIRDLFVPRFSFGCEAAATRFVAEER